VEKRDKREGVVEGCQCTTSLCGRRERVMYCIVDNCTMLCHDAERHDPNTAMTTSKIDVEPDLIYFNNIVEPHIKIMIIMIKMNFYTL
jgi:hypothetical protein